HDAAQLRIVLAAFRHDRDLGIAPDVHDFLRLAVRRHVDRAINCNEVHRYQVWESFLVHGGERDFPAFAQKPGLLVGAELDLFAPVHGDLSGVMVRTRAPALISYAPARTRRFDRSPAALPAGVSQRRATRGSFPAILPGLPRPRRPWHGPQCASSRRAGP